MSTPQREMIADLVRYGDERFLMDESSHGSDLRHPEAYDVYQAALP
jgi:hypothetical protein